MKVIFIQSFVATAEKEIYGNGKVRYAQKSYPYSYVYDLPEETANKYITEGLAIPFDGWETNPKRPFNIKFPNTH